MKESAWALAAAGGEDEERARRLAARTGAPLVAADERRFPFLLLVDGRGLELRQTAPGSPGPLYIDFTDGAMSRRLRTSGVRSPLARALGVKPNHRPAVVDATAGLGRDAFVLAHLGCSLVLLERVWPVYLLLEDALRRARDDARTREAALRIRLFHYDAARWLGRREEPVEAVYLDPMYPARAKNALSAKGMQALQRLAGDDADAPELLEAALRRCKGRVVVKRPKRAGPLGRRRPDFSIAAPKTRYDVYLAGC